VIGQRKAQGDLVSFSFAVLSSAASTISCSVCSSSWSFSARGNSDIETLSAKQAGVDGQRARSQKCEGYNLRRQEDGALRVSSACENDPYLTQRYNRAGNWRPQTDEQKNTCDGSDYLQRNRFTLRRPHPGANAIVGQNRYDT
jgi:hypothetical protein